MTAPLTLQPQALADVATDARNAAVARTGTVVSYDSGSITVRISGSDVLVSAARLLFYDVDLGETVLVVRKGASWVVIGSLSGDPEENRVRNYSFENDVIGALPAEWTYVHDTGSTYTPTVAVGSGTTDNYPPPDGQKMLEIIFSAVFGAGVGFCSDALHSNPIAVAPGQRWAASAYAIARPPQEVDGFSFSGSVIIVAHVNAADVYPTGLIIASNGTDVPMWRPWLRIGTFSPGYAQPMRGVLIPDGYHYIRVGLFSTTSVVQNIILTGGSTYFAWDRITARRLS